MLAQLAREFPGTNEGLCPQRDCTWRSGGEQVLQDAVPFTMMPMQRPEAPQGGSEVQGGLQLTLLDQPGEGSPQILMFALKSLQPLLLLWADESVLCLFCQPQVVGRVRLSHGLHLLMRSQRLPCVFVHGIEHQQAWLVIRLFSLLREAFVNEGGDGFEHVCLRIVKSVAHSLRRLQGAAADEDGQAAAESLFLGIQEIVTALDGGAQGSLALRKIACSPC